MSRPIGTPEELARRRQRAVQLVDQGDSPLEVARFLGVHETTVHAWRRLARTPQGLAPKPHPGPKPRLTDDQVAQLKALLLPGAEAHGWTNQLWTADRVATVVRRHFGVTYHPEHLRKILRDRLGWTSQKPQPRAREHNDKEVERWKDDEFGRILRDAWERSAHLIFLDESGLMLTPTVRRTLAPRGRTPVLPAWDRHDRISVLSCVTLDVRAGRPELYFELLPAGLNAGAFDVVAFLRELRRALPGPWTVVWDRHNIHSKARLVQEWLAGEPEVVLEDLPSYAPALNPDEMVWSWLKYGRLANLTPQDVGQLRDHIDEELHWAAFDGELLAGFLNHAHLGILL